MTKKYDNILYLINNLITISNFHFIAPIHIDQYMYQYIDGILKKNKLE